MQRNIKMYKVTAAVVTKNENGVNTELYDFETMPKTEKKLLAEVKEKFGNNAFVLNHTEIEKMTYMSLDTWLAHCTTEPVKD